MNYNQKDIEYMHMALDLARRGGTHCSPNPMVGCVIVKDERIIAQGYHEKYGAPHAEANAVKNAGESIEGASVYVTLEPCSHFGKTPPCANLLAKHKPKEVVIGMGDPNPKVNGRGIEILKSAGITVKMPLLEAECRYLNRGFLSRVERGRPWVTLKSAVTLDGCVATKNGESKWITGEASRLEVQRMRAQNDALLTGCGTVLADNPLLTVRDVSGETPVRVVLDTTLKTPLDAKIFDAPEKLMFFTDIATDKTKIKAYEAHGAKVFQTAFNCDKQISNILTILAENGINYLMVEAGPRLTSSMLKAGVVDEIVLFVAPKLVGNGLHFTQELCISSLCDAIKLDKLTVQNVGDDLMLKGLVKCSQD